MLKILRSWSGLALLAIAVAIAATIVVRLVRRAPPQPSVTAVETDPIAPSGDTKAVDSDGQPVAAVVVPTAGAVAAAPDARATPTAPIVRPAPEVGAPVAVKPVVTPAPLFDDARSMAKSDATARPVAPPRETAATVPTRAAPVAVPAFEDTRGSILQIPAAAGQAPAGQGPTGQDPTRLAATAPAPEAATARVRPAGEAVTAVQPPRQTPSPVLPGFTDQRELAPPAVRPPVSAERGETVARAPQANPAAGSQPVDRREPAQRSSSPPLFVDARDPRATADASQPAATAVAPTRLAVAASAPRDPVATAPTASPCEPAKIASEPLDGGRMLVRVGTPCRAEQSIRFGYGGASVVRKLDGAGRLELTLDLFAGTASPIEIVFEDGTSRELPARASDLDKLEKIALIWRAPVDLDLHAFEYGATFGQPGHVWAEAPSSALAAREQVAAGRRGRGFLSRADNGQGSGQGSGDKIEVYTFFRYPDQPAGIVSIAIDFATRGDVPSGATCGTGPQALVKFETVVTARGRVTREAGELAPAACGTPLAADARFGILHQIRVNR